jgi:hypothetical protein
MRHVNLEIMHAAGRYSTQPFHIPHSAFRIPHST